MSPRARIAPAAAYAACTFLSFPHPLGDRVIDLGPELAWLAASQALESCGLGLKDVDSVAVGSAPDAFGQYLAAGLTTAVCLTATLHMAVTLKLMPTTGLTLPFMSHGGSSLLMNLAATGVLVNIGRMRGRPAA